MEHIVWIGIGCIMGGFVSLVLRPDDVRGLTLNFAVGIFGAFVGAWLVSPVVGINSPAHSGLSLTLMLLALTGSAVLLAVINLFQRGSLRPGWAVHARPGSLEESA